MRFPYHRLLAVALIFTGSCCLGQNAFPSLDSRHHGNETADSITVSGSVRNVFGKPVRDARIEGRVAITGTTVSSTYTNDSGAFQLVLSPGSYEIVAQSGLSEARERVATNDAGATVNLKIDDGSTSVAGVGDAGVVTARQFRVPDKARNELRKAEQASRKKPEEFEKHIAAALAIYPEFAEALTTRALARLDQQQTESAIADLEHAIKADPSYAMGYLVLGAAYNLDKHWDDAIRSLDRGLALQPTSWQGFFELGKAYVGKADYEHALRSLDKAQAIAPADYAPLHLVRAHALLSMKEYKQAMGELQAYLEHAPKDAQSAQVEHALARVRALVATSTTAAAH
jgi:regulator of sirC expression with transglutaminase-like and TPR domain